MYAQTTNVLKGEAASDFVVAQTLLVFQQFVALSEVLWPHVAGLLMHELLARPLSAAHVLFVIACHC